MKELSESLVEEIKEAIRKTNAHINSGVFDRDERNVENIFINFVKKTVKSESIKTHSYMFRKQVKPDRVFIGLDKYNKISMVIFRPHPNYYATQELMEYLNLHVDEIDLGLLSIEFDVESFSRACYNSSQKIAMLSFTGENKVLKLYEERDNFIQVAKKELENIQTAIANKEKEFLNRMKNLEEFYTKKRKLTVAYEG